MKNEVSSSGSSNVTYDYPLTSASCFHPSGNHWNQRANCFDSGRETPDTVHIKNGQDSFALHSVCFRITSLNARSKETMVILALGVGLHDSRELSQDMIDLASRQVSSKAMKKVFSTSHYL